MSKKIAEYLVTLKLRNQALLALCDLLENNFKDSTLPAHKKVLEEMQFCLECKRKDCNLSGGYDPASHIKLQGAILDCGYLVGDSTDKVLSNAEKWMKRMPAEGNDCSLYEMGSYLMLILQE